MPSINDAFPSNYLKAADLKGQPRLVVMRSAQFEQMGDDNKLILYFQDFDKGLVLNKTNANNIALVYGDETDDWAGQQIVLFEAMVDFQGKTVPAIRVRMPQARDRKGAVAAQPRQSPSSAQHNEANPPPAMDDEIPF